MGLEQRNEGKFITILSGKFCQRVQEGTEGAISRTNKLGNTVWEKFYDSFTGRLINIKTQEGTYGKQWVFVFDDRGDIYSLQLPYSNTFATALLKILPNVDTSKEMKLSPSVKMIDGKNRSTLFVNQDGKVIKHAYTREVPNGMPDMEQITVKGIAMWDDTKRLQFLENEVMTKVLPKLMGSVSTMSSPVNEPIPGSDEAIEQATDDLPW